MNQLTNNSENILSFSDDTIFKLHSIITGYSDDLKNCLKQCGVFSENISFYRNNEVIKDLIHVLEGLTFYHKFLTEEKIVENLNYDFKNIEGDIFFCINMFSFNTGEFNKIHNSAIPLLFADSYVVNLKGKQYYPLWMLKVLCKGNFFDGIWDNKQESSSKKTYLMFDTNTSLYKIGFSNDPTYREKTLRSDKPTVDLLFYCSENIEKRLHETYSSKRVRGEWFRLSEDDVLDIFNEMKEMNGFTVIKTNNEN